MSQAFRTIEAAYKVGGLTRALWAYAQLFPDRPQTAALAFAERHGWV